MENKKIQDMLAECQGYDYVRFIISDMNGLPLVKAVPARHLEKFITEGIRFWSDAIFMSQGSTLNDGLMNNCSQDDAAMRPVPGTFHPIPWATDKYKVGAFLCEPQVLGTDVAKDGSSRAIARKQLTRLSEMGLKLSSGSEMEFLLLDKETKSKPFIARYSYLDGGSHAACEDFMYEAYELLKQTGINVETLEKEMPPGQLELTTAPADGIEGPDQVFKFKAFMKEIAAHHDMFATFMSMPFPPLGSGQHFNFSIWDHCGNNKFYDDSKDDKLSDFARHWIAGFLKHCRALTALMSPTVNCYRRYHNPWAPDKVNWGLYDRTCTLRVKNDGKTGCYMENRLPAGVANPYIVLAATVAAGLDGVINKLPCPPPMTVEEAEERVPDTLEEALQCLKDDNVLREAVGEDFIKFFLLAKEDIELAKFPGWSAKDKSDEILEKERKEYLEFL